MKTSLDSHQDRAQTAAETLKPGSITYDSGGGPQAYVGGISCAPREVDTDKGGRQVLDSIIANISKTAMATPPEIGDELIHETETYTVYMTAGKKAKRWKIHAAKFPK